MKSRIIFLSTALLTACAGTSIVPPDDFEYHEIQTSRFTIASWQKITDETAPIKIYIEGDGHSFNSRGYPTNNPTPHGDFLRQHAFNDAGENIVYMGRPCQFVMNEKCEQKYWTTARFSAAAVQSITESVKAVSGTREIELVGYSGGGQIAGLVAVMHPEINITHITNYAPNLDHKRWTHDMHLHPLSDSLSLRDWHDEYLLIPQMNYIPEKDSVIAPQITIDFLKNNTALYQIIPGKNHGF